MAGPSEPSENWFGQGPSCKEINVIKNRQNVDTFFQTTGLSEATFMKKLVGTIPHYVPPGL